MKYVVIQEPGRVTVLEGEIPTPGPGEVLLRMRYGGVCGSDLGIYRGTFAYGSYPRIPGHELAAEVADPNGHPHLPAGLPVTVNPYFHCGSCYSCRRGLLNCCQSNQTMGVHREGGFAQYVAMPAERLYPAPGLSFRDLALIEPFAIGRHAVRQAEVKPGERVLVAGAGTIGMMTAIAAKQAGGEVTVCDIDRGKLDLALAMGADHAFLNGDGEAAARHTREITGEDGFDVAFEAAGLPGTLQGCVDAAAFGGRVIVVGVISQPMEFLFVRVQQKELRILGSRNARREDFQELIDLVGAGKVELDPLISGVYPVDRSAQAFRDFDGDRSVIKLLVEF